MFSVCCVANASFVVYMYIRAGGDRRRGVSEVGRRLEMFDDEGASNANDEANEQRIKRSRNVINESRMDLRYMHKISSRWFNPFMKMSHRRQMLFILVQLKQSYQSVGMLHLQVFAVIHGHGGVSRSRLQ